MRTILVLFVLGVSTVLQSTWAEEPMGGIGVALALDREAKTLKVIRVVPETPAAKAGVIVGSSLYRIGDTETSGKSLADCVALIRGPVGSKLKLEFIDPTGTATNRFELVREQIKAPGKARIGDPAAPLLIKEWVQGGPVNVRDGKSVYVVEFWATWCGPCRVSIPHLSALQKHMKDKGVVVVGISDEDPATVKPFVKTMGEKMDYAVACDDLAQTSAGYMQAYGVTTIPTAFIVGKDGRVLWQGHPMAGLENALERIVSTPPTPAP